MRDYFENDHLLRRLVIVGTVVSAQARSPSSAPSARSTSPTTPPPARSSVNQFSVPVPEGLVAKSPLLLHLNVSGNKLSGSPDFAGALQVLLCMCQCHITSV